MNEDFVINRLLDKCELQINVLKTSHNGIFQILYFL